MQGWIKLHRKIIDSPVFNEPGMLKLWIYCLMKASHKQREVLIGQQLVELQPGQFITGRNALSDDFNNGAKPKDKVSAITLWRWLQTLEKMGNLNIKTNNKFSVITLDKWGVYQGEEEESEQQNEHQMNNKRTSNEHQMNTNKNVNNGNNGENEKNKKPSYPKFEICDMELSKYFYSLILENNENAKQPNFETWAKDIRLMRERDNRKIEHIRYMMNWAQQDSFWKVNILSPSKLREKYDQLLLKAKAEHEKKNQPIKSDMPRAYASMEQWAMEDE
jgi:hypothetical protein